MAPVAERNVFQVQLDFLLSQESAIATRERPSSLAGKQKVSSVAALTDLGFEESAALAALVAKSGDVQAAAALLMERRQPARWATPLAMLPERFDTPLYYTPEQLAWLQGSSLVAWNHGREQAMLRSLSSLQDRWTTRAPVQSNGAVAEGDARALGIDELRWALSVARSRAR